MCGAACGAPSARSLAARALDICPARSCQSIATLCGWRAPRISRRASGTQSQDTPPTDAETQTNQFRALLRNTRAFAVPPKWTRPPLDIEATAGASVVVDCQAQAYPAARIW